ncbi:MAG: DUF3847 domain-containing protein [Oscillospiraceae bacterium]|nr:DUF3847 domain-containing protein [Oscillospiraceae bacterium]
MAKTSLEKIAGYDEQIVQLMNRKKQEMQKHKQTERKTRTKRLCSRMGLIEKMLPDTIALTDEQFQTFLQKTTANDFGRRELAKLVAQGGDSTKSAKTKTSPQGIAPAPAGGSDCTEGTG